MNESLYDALGVIDKRPKKNGWAPGMYTCTCNFCHGRFMGDKRAFACADCGYDDTNWIKKAESNNNDLCLNCEILGKDYTITGITTRPGVGIIGITIRQKWNDKLVLLEIAKGKIK